MSYSIPSSTKILSLTASSFLFILVAAMSVCQFAMVHRRHRYTHSAAQSSESFNKPLSVTTLLWQGRS